MRTPLWLGLALVLLGAGCDIAGDADGGRGGGGSAGGGSASGGGSPAGGGAAAGGGSAGGAATGGGAAGGGSAGGGAAAGGAGATGGGAATTTGCAGAAGFFCEDFEQLDAGTFTPNAKWNTQSNMGTLTVDGTHAHGAGALHVHTSTNGFAMIKLKSFSPPTTGFYGRVFLWVTAFPSAPNYAHFTLVEASGAGNSTLVRPVGGQYIPGNQANKSLWGVGSDVGPTGDWLNWKTSAPAKSGEWVCMEFHMDTPNDGVDIWLNGVAQPDLHVDKTHHGGNNVDFIFPTINNLWFGWWLYQGGSTPAAFDLWIDDIVLGGTQVGCP